MHSFRLDISSANSHFLGKDNIFVLSEWNLSGALSPKISALHKLQINIHRRRQTKDPACGVFSAYGVDGQNCTDDLLIFLNVLCLSF